MRVLAAPARAFLAAAFVAFPVGSVPPGDERASSVLASGEVEPVLRIGLEARHRIALDSGGPYRIVDPESGAAVWRETYSGETLAIAEGGPEGEPPSVYRIQAGAFSTEESAEAERRRLEQVYGEPAIVRRNPDRGSFRVRLGLATSREELSPLLARVRRDGMASAWVAEEAVEEKAGVSIRLVDRSFESLVTGARRLAVLPSPGAFVSVDGKRYRGTIEIRVTPAGHVRAVNWIGLEAYLRGVVPAEMGPEVWPQIEALKAQAVAARTYAWRNRGRFDEEGFDVCATPRCQVYGGASAEHPLTDRAVAATRGEIVVFDGEPISALYTATCGGHTEDASEVFPEEDAPYLKGVPCRAEGAQAASLLTELSGRPPFASVRGEEDAGRDLALLVASGVLGPGGSAPGTAAQAGSAEIRAATTALAALAGIPAPRGRPPDAATLASALRAIVEDLGWGERLGLLLSDADVEALLRDDPERASLAPPEARAVAYLASLGALRPGADGRFRAGAPPTWARLAPVLVRIGDSYEAFGLREGVAGAPAGDGRLRVISGRSESVLRMAASPHLFSTSGGRAVSSGGLVLWPGDRIRFRTDRAGRVDFVELCPPVKGASDDRSAAVHSWEVRKTRDELEQSLGRRFSIGEPRSFRVLRRGVSGRIVEMEITGGEGAVILRGFDVRTALDLRESLVSLEIQRDPEGNLEAVVFAGKGWGHGVGLCQVGAYGMAVRGATYRGILGHYYRGTEVRPLAVEGPAGP